jgi:hypothetical protein
VGIAQRERCEQLSSRWAYQWPQAGAKASDKDESCGDIVSFSLAVRREGSAYPSFLLCGCVVVVGYSKGKWGLNIIEIACTNMGAVKASWCEQSGGYVCVFRERRRTKRRRDQLDFHDSLGTLLGLSKGREAREAVVEGEGPLSEHGKGTVKGSKCDVQWGFDLAPHPN